MYFIDLYHVTSSYTILSYVVHDIYVHINIIHPSLSLSLFVFLFISLSLYLSLFLFLYIYIYPSFISLFLAYLYLNLYLTLCLSHSLSIHLSIYLCIHLSISQSIDLIVCLSIYLSITICYCPLFLSFLLFLSLSHCQIIWRSCNRDLRTFETKSSRYNSSGIKKIKTERR